jgi:hydrogenase nickel incorporation protein HypA/HybF
MHELSIALRIVETLTEELADQPGRVESVRVKVGALSGVVPDALRFAWDAACDDSRLAGSALEIEEVDVVARCPRCEADRVLDSVQLLQCPVCGSLTPDIVAGRELEIVSVEIDDDGEAG